jgi:hypothetical protein
MEETRPLAQRPLIMELKRRKLKIHRMVLARVCLRKRNYASALIKKPKTPKYHPPLWGFYKNGC